MCWCEPLPLTCLLWEQFPTSRATSSRVEPAEPGETRAPLRRGPSGWVGMKGLQLPPPGPGMQVSVPRAGGELHAPARPWHRRYVVCRPRSRASPPSFSPALFCMHRVASLQKDAVPSPVQKPGRLLQTPTSSVVCKVKTQYFSQLGNLSYVFQSCWPRGLKVLWCLWGQKRGARWPIRAAACLVLLQGEWSQQCRAERSAGSSRDKCVSAWTEEGSDRRLAVPPPRRGRTTGVLLRPLPRGSCAFLWVTHSFTPQLAAQWRSCEAVEVLGMPRESLLMAACSGPMES